MEKEHKKIGIVTITGESNYGNTLQNYAVKKVLENMGNTVFTLKTQYEPNFSFFSKYNIKQYGKCILKKSDYCRFTRKIKFYFFSNKYLNKIKKLVDEHNTNLYGEKFDYLVFGSDQIWNFTWGGRLCDGINFYTGGFAFDIPKFAYSASIGADYIPDQYVDDFRNNIQNFIGISVREKKAKQVIEKTVGQDVVVTIDPTLMLEKNLWKQIEKKPKYIRSKDKFILTYFLGDINENIDNYITSISRIYNYKVINLYNEYESLEHIKSFNDFSVGPSEFLWLVDNCELMLTDSFHGCCFSVIFKKPFRWFSRCEEGVSSMNSRMETLFEKLQLDDKFIGNTEEYDGLLDVDYSKTDELILKEQEFAYNYLKGALNLNEN